MCNSTRAADDLVLEQIFSRGLGPYFVTGTNHQQVVKGRTPRHRGVQMGRVVRVLADRVLVAPSEAHAVAPLTTCQQTCVSHERCVPQYVLFEMRQPEHAIFDGKDRKTISQRAPPPTQQPFDSRRGRRMDGR